LEINKVMLDLIMLLRHTHVSYTGGVASGNGQSTAGTNKLDAT